MRFLLLLLTAGWLACAPTQPPSRARPASDPASSPSEGSARPEASSRLAPAPPAARAPQTSADTDGDGVPDHRDQCPRAPEDLDGFEDADGCPEPDNDRDGIPDVQDKCPNSPETKNGHQDGDGCPD